MTGHKIFNIKITNSKLPLDKVKSKMEDIIEKKNLSVDSLTLEDNNTIRMETKSLSLKTVRLIVDFACLRDKWRYNLNIVEQPTVDGKDTFDMDFEITVKAPSKRAARRSSNDMAEHDYSVKIIENSIDVVGSYVSEHLRKSSKANKKTKPADLGESIEDVTVSTDYAGVKYSTHNPHSFKAIRNLVDQALSKNGVHYNMELTDEISDCNVIYTLKSKSDDTESDMESDAFVKEKHVYRPHARHVENALVE